MPHKVSFSKQADTHLRKIGRYIAKKKSARVATNYIADILETCNSLATFPNRGVTRDDLLPGLRSIGFRDRVEIAFLVLPDTVEILAVLYGGRDLDTYFKSRVFH